MLVYAAGFGLAGSAVANVAAQAVGAALFLVALRRTRVALSPQRRVIRAQAVVGRDLILRAAAFQVAFLSAAAVASRMGTAQLAAHQIGLQLWDFTALMLDSFAIAAQSLVGAALGRSDAAAARGLSWQVARWGLAAGVGLAAVFAATTTVLPRLFTSSAAVIGQAHVLWPWLVAMLPAAGVVFALDGVLIGAGDVGFLRTLTVISAVGVFAPIVWLALRLDWGLGGVWAGLAGFVVVRLVGMLWRVRGDRWSVVGTEREGALGADPRAA